MNGFNGDIKNEYLKLLEKYDQLGWKIIPVEGKQPLKGWTGYNNSINWENETYSNELTIRKILNNPHLNVGAIAGPLSNVIFIDVDQPNILGFDPTPAIKKGALAHTTSRAPRLVIRSNNPEVLAISKKLSKRRDEIDTSLLCYPEDNEKESVTIIEILGGNKRYAVLPPSIHPDKGIKYVWLTPLPDSPDQILTINSIEELYALLLECCKNKELINELFEDYFKQKAIEDTGEEGGEADELLEKWLKIILKHLDVAEDKGDYIQIHCPFHPPDNKPSFAIYRNTYLAVDFHDGKVYRLKELAERLGIELPRGKRATFEEKVKEFGLDKYGITADDLKFLASTIFEVQETRDGDIRIVGLKHGAFAQWFREKWHFATNALTEEIWMYHEDEGVWRPDGEQFIKKICELVLNALERPEFATIRRIAEVVHHIKRYPQITPDIFNKAWRNGWVNCKNGVINIFTGEFREHRPTDFFTWRINAEYDPDAKGEVVERFLSTVSEDRELLEEIIAYTLVPGQPFKKFFVLFGPTDAGKSTFIHLIEKFLGKENCSNVALQQLEKNRFAPSELVGKLANLFADLPPAKLEACPILKAITGEDTIYVEKKFQKGYFTKIDAKLIFSANELPDVNESDAFWNRVVIVKFSHKFPKNEKFKEELTKPGELSALLNIVLKAIPRLFEKRFEGDDINKAIKLWKLASDPLSVFIDERIEIYYTADDDFIDSEIYEFKGDVFDAFKQFCLKHGVESKYATDYNLFCRMFVKKLADRGIRLREGKKERDGKRLRVWWGIKLKRDEEDDENQNNESPPDTDSRGDDNNGNGSDGNSNDREESNDIQDFSVESAMGLSKDEEEVWNEFVESVVKEQDTKEQNDKSTDDGQNSREPVTHEMTKDVDFQLLRIYENLKKSVPPELLPSAFSKAVRKEFGSVQSVKTRIEHLVKNGKLPQALLDVEDTIRVKAIDYVHIIVNGREYRADTGKILEMPLKDYESLHPEVRGFLIPVDDDFDSLPEYLDCSLSFDLNVEEVKEVVRDG